MTVYEFNTEVGLLIGDHSVESMELVAELIKYVRTMPRGMWHSYVNCENLSLYLKNLTESDLNTYLARQ